MIHDKTDEEHWTANVDDWSEFDHNDVVVGLDPQERLGEETYSVARIDKTSNEQVEQFGLFWQKKVAMLLARAFAEKVSEAREVTRD